jgi:hypothetical protein
VAVGIANEYLPRPIGTHFARTEIGFRGRQMVFPFIKVIDAKREVIATIVGVNSFGAVADDVEFLHVAEAEPCAGKCERRPRDDFKLQNGLIELATRLDIPDMDRDMV